MSGTAKLSGEARELYRHLVEVHGLIGWEPRGTAEEVERKLRDMHQGGSACARSWMDEVPPWWRGLYEAAIRRELKKA